MVEQDVLLVSTFFIDHKRHSMDTFKLCYVCRYIYIFAAIKHSDLSRPILFSLHRASCYMKPILCQDDAPASLLGYSELYEKFIPRKST